MGTVLFIAPLRPEPEVSMHPRSTPGHLKLILSVLCAVWLAACAKNPAPNPGAGASDLTLPPLLPLAKQIEVREGWLVKRHEMLLPLMRKHGVGMWIIVNEEFHDDPLTELIAPPRPYCGNRDIFVFVDAGESGLKKFAVLGYIEENVERFFELSKPGEGIKALKAWDEEFRPKTIALGIGGRRGVTRSLTYETYKYLVENLGPEAEKRFITAAPLIEDYLDTRLSEEFEEYAKLVQVTEILGHRALSNEVIVPGKTTVGDIRRWLYSQLGALGLRTWFQPDLRVQRRDAAEQTSRGFLRVAEEPVVIRRGDVVHLDFGLTYMGLNSDWQKMLYVLREGETYAPDGLQKALANTNAVQDAVIRASRPDKPAGDVYEEAMAELKAKGITAQVYSHPLGNQGHGLGASIDFRSAKRDPREPGKRLRGGSYLALELNSQTEVPEWGGQKVTMMAEDPVYLTDEGWKFFRPRQEKLYLVR
jgi:Xaa-Pro dipeptidase